MQLRLEALEPHLAKGLAGLYTVYGDEPLLAQEACDRIRAAARAAGFTERSVFTVERSFDWSSLLGASQAMSLFGERQLIELRIPSGKPGKEGADALKTLAGAGNPEVLMLVTLPRLDAATQKSAWFTALGNGGVALKIDPVDRAQLPNWIGQRLAAQGQRVAAATMAGARCSSSPSASRATCWPRTRRSRSSGCSIRPARWPSSRCRMPCSTWRATTSSSSTRRCWPATRAGWRA